jgi:glycerol-3-phosphate cytidylyltransferase-like family protein
LVFVIFFLELSLIIRIVFLESSRKNITKTKTKGIISESSRKNIKKTKTKRIISESSRKNITKTKTKRIISESSRKNITKTKRIITEYITRPLQNCMIL